MWTIYPVTWHSIPNCCDNFQFHATSYVTNSNFVLLTCWVVEYVWWHSCSHQSYSELQTQHQSHPSQDSEQDWSLLRSVRWTEMTAVHLDLNGFWAYVVVLAVDASALVSPQLLFPSKQQVRTPKEMYSSLLHNTIKFFWSWIHLHVLHYKKYHYSAVISNFIQTDCDFLNCSFFFLWWQTELWALKKTGSRKNWQSFFQLSFSGHQVHATLFSGWQNSKSRVWGLDYTGGKHDGV